MRWQFWRPRPAACQTSFPWPYNDRVNATEDVRTPITTAFLADAISKLHDTGPGHPEQAARWDAAVRALGDHPTTAAEPRTATPDELGLCHTAEYIRIARHD